MMMRLDLQTLTLRQAPARMFCAGLVLGLALLLAFPIRAQQHDDWMANLRKQVAAHRLALALDIANQRLAVAPGDTDARGWRARILGWLGQLQEAENEYRAVLRVTPRDSDVLGGLAWVLAREQHQQQALLLLDEALEIDPAREDLRDQRNTLLRSMEGASKRRPGPQTAYAGTAGSLAARIARDASATEARHELRISSDTDAFNYTDTANAETLELISHWDSTWTTSFSGIFYQRFGEDARKFSGSVGIRLGKTDSFSLGGAAARDQGVIPRSEAFFEYGHGFRVSRTRLLRGLETDFGSHWFWYRDARVLALTGSAVLYLPRDWNFLVAVTPARSAFSGTGPEWRPSGISKLTFPLHRRITANLFFAVGTENFAQADQIGRFSARTFGGGAKYRFARRQEVSFYALRQNRSQGRTQTSIGVSYGLRF
jgi:tetratricopeptide (TPR) repeat protein